MSKVWAYEQVDEGVMWVVIQYRGVEGLEGHPVLHKRLERHGFEHLYNGTYRFTGDKESLDKVMGELGYMRDKKMQLEMDLAD